MSEALQTKPQFNLKLSVVRGPHAGQSFDFDASLKPSITIGRGPENDLVLLNDPLVSRAHAELVLLKHEFEIVKVTARNSVIVAGESVDKWKLVNGSTFVVGDSEIKMEYNFGEAVVSVPQSALAQVVPIKPKVDAPSYPKPPPVPAKSHNRPVPLTSSPPLATSQNLTTPQMQRPQQPMPNPSRPVSAAPAPSFIQGPRFRFYAIAAVVIAIAVYFVLSAGGMKKSSRPKPTLKYEDEISIKLNSTSEKDLIKKRNETKLDRSSPQYLRAQENFMKGMRDFNLGNYARAQEFFQVVLNLDSDNALAKRHLYLSKVRFDELVQTKLMLGESYYSKHNFKMCASMYQQVVNMLDDKRADLNYKLAERKAKECELASEGIR